MLLHNVRKKTVPSISKRAYGLIERNFPRVSAAAQIFEWHVIFSYEDIPVLAVSISILQDTDYSCVADT
jgi:hypothetical protein